MIAQISTGEGFGGLVNYANDIIKKDTVIIASYGVNLSSNATITASFKAQAKARPTIQKFVGHISLSFSPDDQEKLDDEKIAEIAKEYMRRMGIVNTLYVIFRHFDQPHPHIHIIYNRVDNEGNGIKGDTSYTKSAAITNGVVAAARRAVVWRWLRVRPAAGEMTMMTRRSQEITIIHHVNVKDRQWQRRAPLEGRAAGSVR